MRIKKNASLTILIISILGLMIFPIVAAKNNGIDYGPKAKLLPSNGKMFGWIKDMWKIGDNGQYGYRMPGTPADWAGAEYVYDKFESFGINAYLEEFNLPVAFPDQWSLTIDVAGVEEVIPAGFVRYAAFTPPEGVSAEMVYVGTGSEAEFEAVDVTDKIAVVDLIAPGLPTAILSLFDMYTYDPENTLPGDMITENWPVNNFDSSYENAHHYGAVGFVGILTFTADDIHQYLHAYADGSLPGLYISPNDGEELRTILLDGQTVEATMVLTGVEGLGTSYNVYGIIPGKTDETIVVLSHHDGWATNEASGMAVVMGLAKYYSQIPLFQRERTLMFLATASHFGKRPSLLEMCELLASEEENIVAAISVEMISKQFKIIDGKFVDTGMISPRAWFISGPLHSGNPYLLDYSIEAITKYDLTRTSVQPALGGLFGVAPGEGGLFAAIGIPVVHLIAHNAPQFTNEDKPNTVMVSALKPTASALGYVIDSIDDTPADWLIGSGPA
ncbi:MAG: hypothetical protein ACXABG_05675 [Promethearchaeota archaeon]|jgi:hypothetical protein